MRAREKKINRGKKGEGWGERVLRESEREFSVQHVKRIKMGGFYVPLALLA